MKDKRYGIWAGCPKGQPFSPNRCAHEITLSTRGHVPYQCRAAPKHAGYCTRHAKMLGIPLIRRGPTNKPPKGRAPVNSISRAEAEEV